VLGNLAKGGDTKVVKLIVVTCTDGSLGGIDVLCRGVLAKVREKATSNNLVVIRRGEVIMTTVDEEVASNVMEWRSVTETFGGCLVAHTVIIDTLELTTDRGVLDQ
jgi:hypothetical protein